MPGESGGTQALIGQAVLEMYNFNRVVTARYFLQCLCISAVRYRVQSTPLIVEEKEQIDDTQR